jgi:hypothetical protein
MAMMEAYPVFTTLTRYVLCLSRIRGILSLAGPIQSIGRAGTALEQSKRPTPFTNIESGTGWATVSHVVYDMNIAF